jgi:hypothetical protein
MVLGGRVGGSFGEVGSFGVVVGFGEGMYDGPTDVVGAYVSPPFPLPPFFPPLPPFFPPSFFDLDSESLLIELLPLPFLPPPPLPRLGLGLGFLRFLSLRAPS